MHQLYIVLVTCCNARHTFNIENEKNVLVYLHIQKTGGTTFNRHLVSDIKGHKCIQHLDDNRKSPSKYHRTVCNHRGSENTWLFSRYSHGWPCGVHADWTALKECVNKKLRKDEGPNKRRYYYVTYIREPLQRFVSEWQHVARGATWKRQKLRCGGQENKVPDCYEGEDWTGVTLKQFLDCPSNLGFNRQTRMLSSLLEVGCYKYIADDSAFNVNKTVGNFLLESAISNLATSIPFFGMLEYQRESQLLFEKTFNLEFVKDFEQSNKTRASAEVPKLTSDDVSRITSLNWADFALYEQAKKIFFERLAAHNIPRPVR